MNRIYTIGETVYDIIFKNDQPVSAKAGGSMLNTAISLGRLGLPVSFISEIGEDKVGTVILNFLKENNVDINFIHHYNDGKTAIALAFLDNQENANYSFYKIYPKDRLNIDLPEPDSNDILLFGSFFSITTEVRKQLLRLINTDLSKKSLLIYDPNFRLPHLKDLPAVKEMILENIKLSSIVRGSDEDFELIFGFNNAEDTFERLKLEGCHFLVYTRSYKSVEFRSDKISFSVEVPKIKPVSTIGAGDSFNAGLIYYLRTSRISADGLDQMTEAQWKEAIRIAIAFSGHVCQHWDNYISKDFALQY